MWTTANRARYDRNHLRYPSDLTDEEWALIEPRIPPAKRGGNKRTVNVREIANGLMYILTRAACLPVYRVGARGALRPAALCWRGHCFLSDCRGDPEDGVARRHSRYVGWPRGLLVRDRAGQGKMPEFC